MDQTQQTTSPAYGPAGKPSPGRSVHYFHRGVNGTGQVTSVANILRADVDTGRCMLFVMDADPNLPHDESPSFRVKDVPFSAEYGKLLHWSWAPVVR